MDRDLVTVVDSTSRVGNLDGDLLASRQVYHPGQRLAVLRREALESSGRRLTTWNDGDVVGSASLTPAELERLALDDRGRGRDSERRSDGSEGGSGEDGVSCRDHLCEF